jgi:transcriptional regulator with XRE-family HTH domain
MILTIGEQIMIYRTRAGLTKKELAEQAFPDLAAPQMKVQKIEQGRQVPTREDIEIIAAILSLSNNELDGLQASVDVTENANKENQISDKAIEAIPKIKAYLKVINSMAEFGDKNLLKDTIANMLRSDRELFDPEKNDSE